MKILVLLSRFPYPLEKGDKLRAYHQIRELSKRHEIHLLTLSDQTIQDEWKQELAPYCASIHILQLNKVLIYWNTAKKFFSDTPYQVGYFYQGRIQRKINQLVRKLDPDHIYCQLVRTAEYVKNFHNIPKTIDYQDALSKGMFRRAEISGGIKKRLFLNEGKRLSEYENRIFDYFDHHTIISEQDKAYINHPNKNNIVVVENGIAQEFFDFKPKDQRKYTLVFTGNMNYPPNIECAEYIVNEILPLLDADVTLALFGASPHPRIQRLQKKGKVDVPGWIDDIKDAYAEGYIFLAPLFIGTGLQNKLLEAMASGLPCVTTALANNALGAVPNEQILIAETPQKYVEHIQHLLEDSTFYDRIALAGKAFVQENFNWESSVLKLEELFGRR